MSRFDFIGPSYQALTPNADAEEESNAAFGHTMEMQHIFGAGNVLKILKARIALVGILVVYLVTCGHIAKKGPSYEYVYGPMFNLPICTQTNGQIAVSVALRLKSAIENAVSFTLGLIIERDADGHFRDVETLSYLSKPKSRIAQGTCYGNVRKPQFRRTWGANSADSSQTAYFIDTLISRDLTPRFAGGV